MEPVKNYYNCHTHSFNAKYVPEYFLSFTISNRPEASILGRLFKTPIVNSILLKLLSLSASGKKYANFLAIGIMKTQDMVFENVKAKYPTGTKIVVLPLNFQFMGAGALRIPYTQQLDDLIELKKKYPDECLPFVFIDPRMGTLQENVYFVESYIEKGFSGIKMYPSLGYAPTDPRLDLVYKYAAEKQIPILTHCSRGGIFYVGQTAPDGNPWPVGVNKDDYKNRFIDPTSYAEVLKKYPTLKLCFAHFGVDDNVPYPTDKTSQVDNWYQKIVDYMNTYENVYTDISYSLTQSGFVKPFINDYLNVFSGKVKDKILYGTDYFMIMQEDDNNDLNLFGMIKKDLGQEGLDKIAGRNVERFLQF